MTETNVQRWFSALSASEKAIMLFRVIWEMTLAVRDVFHEGDLHLSARTAYQISELNHRLASAGTGLLEGRPTYPDEVLMEILLSQAELPELSPYFPAVLERAVEYVKSHQKKH